MTPSINFAPSTKDRNYTEDSMYLNYLSADETSAIYELFGNFDSQSDSSFSHSLYENMNF